MVLRTWIDVYPTVDQTHLRPLPDGEARTIEVKSLTVEILWKEIPYYRRRSLL